MERMGASDLHVGGEVAWPSIGQGVADGNRVLAARLDLPRAHAESPHLQCFAPGTRCAQVAHPLAMVLHLVVAGRPRRHPYYEAVTLCRSSHDDLDARNCAPCRLGGAGCQAVDEGRFTGGLPCTEKRNAENEQPPGGSKCPGDPLLKRRAC